MSKFYKVTVNGTEYEVQVEEVDSFDTVSAPADNVQKPAPAPVKKAEVKKPAAAPAPAAAGEGTKINAPMQGTILSVAVSVGADVKKGDVICILEAMKMENEIFAPCDGKVTSVAVTKGQSVPTGALIATVG